MHYISIVLCLLTFAQLPVFNYGEPLFGKENVHIKVHVPAEVTHSFPEKRINCALPNRITHSNHHHQHKHRKYSPHKPVRTQLRHNQNIDLLENILISEFENPTENEYVELTKHAGDTNEYLTHHNEGYNSDNGKTVLESPENYVKTYKIIEYIEPTLSKHQHKPKTQNELYKIVESKYLPQTVDGHELKNTGHYPYPVRTQTKSTKPHINSKMVTYPTTANDYNGIKHAQKIEPAYIDVGLNSHDDFKPNTNIYLPPYKTSAISVDQTDKKAYKSLTPKETLSLPTKEAEDFHAQFKYPVYNGGHFKPFLGDKYLPVGEESSVTQEAAETYTGIDSYSASHIQGLDHHRHSPYRRWSTLI